MKVNKVETFKLLDCAMRIFCRDWRRVSRFPFFTLSTCFFRGCFCADGISPLSFVHRQLRNNRNAAAAATAAAASTVAVTFLSEDTVHPPELPWAHLGMFSSYDCGALRRGFQVYRQVCATCHSIERIRWRELEGVTHTKEQLKAMAADTDVVDGPNDEGEMFERPGKLSDPLPSPYANDAVGRLANNGALPPDLSLMVKARHSGQDYLFSLLTGYIEPPAGKPMMPGLHYNPYFPGGGIAMPPPLSDGGVEYEDGTVATISQQARDVVEFLNWCAEPEADARKLEGAVVMASIAFMLLGSGYYKRFKWSPYKTRAISYVKQK
jgi:ubiquinol-cytochrome c reductase cytochrome c1 subunit